MSDSSLKRQAPSDENEEEPSKKKQKIEETKTEVNEPSPPPPPPKDLKELTKAKVDEFLSKSPIPAEDVAVDDPRTAEEVFGLVKRQVVHMNREFDVVHLFEFDNISCDGAPVIISFPSVGLVGVLTGKQIVKTLNLPLIGIIKVQQFQVACVVSHEQPSHPGRIYGNKHCVVFICEMYFRVPPDAMQNLVQCIYDFAHRHRSPMIYVLEGMPKPNLVQLPTGEEVEICIKNEEGNDGGEEESPVDMLIDDSILAKLTVRERLKEKSTEIVEPGDIKIVEKTTAESSKKKKKGRKRKSNLDDEEEERQSRISKLADKLFGDKIHYVTTSEDLARNLRKLGHVPVVDGIIPGVAGGLLAEAPIKTKDVTAFLAPTSTLFPDPDSAILVLKLLHTLIPNIGLDKTATELEKDVASLKKMMKGLMQNLTSGVSLRRSGTLPPGMYQ